MTDKLKSYQFLNTLGQGSFSTVSKVKNIENGNIYACKIVPKSNLIDPGDQNRFQREINAMAFIRHENIVALYDFFWDTKNFYLIIDHCEGGELYENIIQNQKYDEPLAALIFKQMATAVSVCHSYGIAHRDLKPENILIDKFPHIKVSDFGLCGYLTKEIMMQTFCGSPCFCSPECLCRVPYDGRLSDVWSLGVILFFMVTGSHPWSTTNTSVMLHQILKGDYCLPQGLSPELTDLIQGMMQVNPRNRFDMDKVLSHPWLNISNQLVNEKYPWMKTIESKDKLRTVSLKALTKECERMGTVREFGIVSPFTEEIQSNSAQKSPPGLPHLHVINVEKKVNATGNAGRRIAFSNSGKLRTKIANYRSRSTSQSALNYLVPSSSSNVDLAGLL
ncbi:AGC family protein kinase [Trichomonas vaginalis G3]|uniref:AGC family protein kinase n=1 Tax=Trichomonas vaginalis (strain ATCC PRA-98 / G3) TaxID=412133 RepID=A2FQP0_TRIV3|nr:protein serine/threonine kinase protein [Trichomonas vaginalis G3]EAX92783.1 AGC family protein kinase [Trichomonas vaginalis G3]KAI5524689.1 protein serine/threonine kinase protein [Trichomonas vaginalis G3]|eukprot:XP_001305713.1 AGC family protein kinase [Trichomonas vaginalis G3]